MLQGSGVAHCTASTSPQTAAFPAARPSTKQAGGKGTVAPFTPVRGIFHMILVYALVGTQRDIPWRPDADVLPLPSTLVGQCARDMAIGVWQLDKAGTKTKHNKYAYTKRTSSRPCAHLDLKAPILLQPETSALSPWPLMLKPLPSRV
jgi:hypothetical protein